jgi:predicted Zn-dependent peptidase
MAKLADFGVVRHEGRLESGIPVVLYERPGMPLSIRAAFMSGSKFDPAGKEGLSHFTEHMLVAGTKRFPSKDKLAAHIERLGGVFGAATSREYMMLNFSLAEPEDIAEAVMLMNEMLTHSLLSEKLLETERGSILQEIDQYLSNPMSVATKNYMRLANHGTSMEHDIIGSPETVKAISGQDVAAFFGSGLTASRMTLIVSGGIKMPQLIAAFNQGLDLPTAPPEALSETIVTEHAPRPQVCVAPFDVNDQIHWRAGFSTKGFLDEDAPALGLLGTIMGGGRAAVLSRILRYERGLVYSVGASPVLSSQNGSWQVGCSCAKESLDEVLELVAGEWQRIASGGITAEELEFAKDKDIKSVKMGLQTSGSWVGSHMIDELFKTGETVVDEIKRLQAVTSADLARVGEKYFKPGSWYGSFAGRITESEVAIPF